MRLAVRCCPANRSLAAAVGLPRTAPTVLAIPHPPLAVSLARGSRLRSAAAAAHVPRLLPATATQKSVCGENIQFPGSHQSAAGVF